VELTVTGKTRTMWWVYANCTPSGPIDYFIRLASVFPSFQTLSHFSCQAPNRTLSFPLSILIIAVAYVWNVVLPSIRVITAWRLYSNFLASLVFKHFYCSFTHSQIYSLTQQFFFCNKDMLNEYLFPNLFST
jgi:hypothetical protein